MVRAKFWVTEINHRHVGASNFFAEVKLAAVYGDGKGNETWSKATPQGQLTMGITNPDAVAAFELGKSYYLDFTPVE